MLLFPLVSAAVLIGRLDAGLIAVFGASMSVFLVREPLAVLARQRFLWKDARPETPAAKRTAVVCAPVLAVCGVWLLGVVAASWLFGMGAAAAALTVLYVWAGLKGFQRSTLLQVVGSLGLSASALLVWLAAGRSPDEVVAVLILLHFIHSAGAVLTIHARLEAIRAERKPEIGGRERRAAWLWQLLQAAATTALAFAAKPWLAAALAVPLAVHLWDLASLPKPGELRRPLKQIGFRELGVSFVVSALLVAGLWAGL